MIALLKSFTDSIVHQEIFLCLPVKPGHWMRDTNGTDFSYMLTRAVESCSELGVLSELGCLMIVRTQMYEVDLSSTLLPMTMNLIHDTSHTYTHARTRTHTYAHTYTHACTHIHTHTCKHARMHTYMYTHVQTTTLS